MTDEPLPRLDLLILARLATGSKPSAPSAIVDALFRLLGSRLTRRECSEQCSRWLETLKRARDIDERRVPTPQGLTRLRKALGVKELPKTWAKVWHALIPALALDLSGTAWTDLKSADELRARIIREHYQLATPRTPTLTQAVDAEIWRSLGFEESGPLTLNKLRRMVLERSLSMTIRAKSFDAAKAGQILAAAATGTTTTDIHVVRHALVERWVFDEDVSDESSESRPEPEPEPEPAPEPAPEPKPKARVETRPAPRPPDPPATPLPLPDWAERVQSLAQGTTAGRYGDEQVFIASVWRTAQAERSPVGRSLAEFKTRLIEANRAGLLRLHRADLVQAMDPKLVRESETQHLNATFHFIEIPARTTP